MRSKDSEVSSSSGLEATKNEDLEDVAAEESNNFEGRVEDRIIVEQNCCPKKDWRKGLIKAKGGIITL